MREQFFLNRPVAFGKLCKVYPPTVNQILDTPDFNAYKLIFTLTQEDIIDELAAHNIQGMLTPFEYVINNCLHNKEFEQLTRAAFQFFLHETFIILPKEKIIVLGDMAKELPEADTADDLRLLHEDDWFELQNLVRESLGEKPEAPYEIELDEHKRRMKELARKRDKVKAKQQGLGFSGMLAAICCMNLGITPLNIGELSYAAVGVLFRYYQAKTRYELQLEQIFSMAVDSKDVKPETWIKNFEELE